MIASTRATLRAAITAMILTACGGAPGPSVPTPVNGFNPADRVVIGDFSRVLAIASAQDRVYVVFPDAIAYWLPLERRWEVPRTPPTPNTLRGANQAIVDPVDRSLWLAAGAQWIHYDPLPNRWDQGPLPAPAEAIALESANPGAGVWYRTANGWVSVPRVGGFATPAPPPRNPRYAPTVDDAMRDLPQLRGLASHVALGPRMTQGTLTAAAPDPQGNGWFLGTSTRGLVFFDRTASDARPIPLGLRGESVGAITPTAEGIWVATDADLRHFAALTRLAPDLSSSLDITGSATTGLPFDLARQVAIDGAAIWLATDQGAVRVTSNGEDVARIGATNGLADDRVFTIAAHRGTVVAGTMHGLSVSHGDSGFRRPIPTYSDAVYSLLSRGDTLWVGTAHGLFAWVPGTDQLQIAEGYRILDAANIPILGIGYVADTMVVMTPDRLIWRSPTSGGWTEGPVLSGTLGSLQAFAATNDGVWLGGAGGVGLVRPMTPPLRVLLAPSQIPDQVTAIAVRDDYLWIGTRRGLVRYLLQR
jgi:hypothetical protein